MCIRDSVTEVKELLKKNKEAKITLDNNKVINLNSMYRNVYYVLLKSFS